MDVEADLLPLQVIAGSQPWSGTYIRENGEDSCTVYLQEQPAKDHVIVWRKQAWCIARDRSAPVLAQQRDETGPLTDRGQQPIDDDDEDDDDDDKDVDDGDGDDDDDDDDDDGWW